MDDISRTFFRTSANSPTGKQESDSLYKTFNQGQKMTVKEFVETTQGKPAFGLEHYHVPKNERLLIPAKSHLLSKSLKKSFIDVELKTRGFVPGPVNYETFVKHTVI